MNIAPLHGSTLNTISLFEGGGWAVGGGTAATIAQDSLLVNQLFITSLNGERIRSVGDLRQKLAAQHGEKDKDAESKDKESKDKTRTVKLGMLRNKSEISLNVELPAPATSTRHVIARRTNI